MKRKILILLCLILFIVSIAGVSAAENLNQTSDDTLCVSHESNEINVIGINEDFADETSMSGDDLIGAGEGTFTDLQEKIDNVSWGSTIYLDKDYVYDDGFDIEGIKIAKPLTIIGNGHKIDALNESRIFNIDNSFPALDNSAKISLNNIEFYNGKSSNGGAIDVHVEYDDIIEIYIDGRPVKIIRIPVLINNCTFVNNSAEDGGVVDGVTSAVNCIFVNNSDCIYDVDSVVDCIFVNNSGNPCIHSRSNLTVSGCNFTANVGGIHAWGNLTVSGCNFTANMDDDIYGNGAYLKNCIFADNINFVIYEGNAVNCTFINNSAGNNGGAMYGGNASDCRFINNSAGYGGGAMYNCNAVYCIFVDNSAEHGGAMYGGNASDCRFINNSALGEYYEEYGYISGDGGAMYGGCAVNCTFDSNYATFDGGAISRSSAFGCTFTNNSVESDYGAIISIVDLGLLWSGITSFKIIDCNIQEDGLNNYKDITVNATDMVLWTSGISDNVTAKISGKNYAPYKYVRLYEDEDYWDILFDISDLSPGIHNAQISYPGNSQHNPFEVSVPIYIKPTTSISSPDVTKYYGGDERLEITLTENDVPIANAEVNVNIDGENFTETTDSKGKAYLPIDFNAGSYDAIISYQDISTTSHIVVNQLTTKTTLSYVNNTYDSVTLTALVSPSDAAGDVVFNVNGKDYTAGNTNGKATYDLTNLAPGSYTVNATYKGDTNHKTSTSSSIKFNIADYVITAPDVNVDYGVSKNFEITLTRGGTPVANANVNINVSGKDYTRTTDSKGKASIPIDFNAGSYDAVVSYGDVSATSHITVNKLASKTALSYVNNAYDSVTLTALVNPSASTGNVVFNVNGNDVSAAVSNGKAIYKLSDLTPGSYAVKATYNGDVNHKSSSDNISFNIREDKVEVSAPDLTKYYKGPERFVVTVKENNVPLAGKNVTINLNGKPYTRTTDEKGEVSMAINLNSGVYNVTSQYEDIRIQSTITVKSTVSGNDVTKIFKNGTQYYATFVDTKGNLMKNTEVKFNINGVFYTRTTNGEGVAKMNINLPPGTYILTAENPNSTEKYTNVIKVLPSIVENHDLTKYYRNESKYTLRIIGDDGNPVGEGVTVRLNINGVFYERKTNASGYMSMNINLPPGKYTVTAEYNGLRASNTITVLSVLETKDLKMSYKDGSKFEAKLLDGKGKPYAGQTVTFNINGVFYQKVTGEDGIARLAINLMAGEYIITSTYNGLNAANKVTISS